MHQRTALLLLVALATVAVACSEAPTGPLRPEGASRNAAAEGGGMFGSGHKSDTTTTTTRTAGATSVTDSTSTGAEAVGGMFGSGH